MAPDNNVVAFPFGRRLGWGEIIDSPHPRPLPLCGRGKQTENEHAGGENP